MLTLRNSVLIQNSRFQCWGQISDNYQKCLVVENTIKVFVRITMDLLTARKCLLVFSGKSVHSLCPCREIALKHRWYSSGTLQMINLQWWFSFKLEVMRKYLEAIYSQIFLKKKCNLTANGLLTGISGIVWLCYVCLLIEILTLMMADCLLDPRCRTCRCRQAQIKRYTRLTFQPGSMFLPWCPRSTE